MKSKIELSFTHLFVVLILACPTTQAEAQDVINSLGAACESGLSPEACEAVRAHDRMNVQTYDQYGRPIPSVYELCREGQMAGGPITEACEVNDLRFSRKGERLVRYDFEKWGYNALDMGVTEKEATKLDSNPTFRERYIKEHGYQPAVKHVESEDDVIGMRNGTPITRASERAYCAANPYKAECTGVDTAIDAIAKQKAEMIEEKNFIAGVAQINAKYVGKLGLTGIVGSIVSRNAEKKRSQELIEYAREHGRIYKENGTFEKIPVWNNSSAQPSTLSAGIQGQ